MISLNLNFDLWACLLANFMYLLSSRLKYVHYVLTPLPLCAYVIYGSPTEQRQPDLQRRLAVGCQPQRFVLLRGHELLPGGRGRTRLGPGRIFKSMTILKDALG